MYIFTYWHIHIPTLKYVRQNQVRLALSPETEQRLLENARAAGLGEGRVVFTDTLASSEHIAAKSHADVFLDTPVYNAHVTAGKLSWRMYM